MSQEESMLVVLWIVDMAMIAYLMKMIITGSYHSFIAKDHGDTSEKASSGLLKVKMATSLIGVSSIHLLERFAGIEKLGLEWDQLYKMLWIHFSFLIGALVLAVIDYLHEKSDSLGNDKH